jgi:hypothetical protein
VGVLLWGFGWVILVFGILAGAIIILGGGLVMWLHSPSMQAIVAKASSDLPPMAKASPFLLWAQALLAIGYTVSIFLFCQTMRGLLRSYAQGLYFAPAITRAYFRLAAIAFALCVMDNMFALVSAFMPVSSSAPRMSWVFEFDFSELFLAVVLLILAQVMAEGARVQEEQTLTV